MKKVVKFVLSFVLVGTMLLSFAGCNKKETVTIYTSSEDYCIAFLQESLDAQFEDLNIVIEFMSTSNIASRVIEEKSSSDCDIVFAEEYAFLEKMAQAESISDVSSLYNKSDYLDDTVASTYSNYMIPSLRTGGGIVVNTAVLTEKGMPVPSSYNDLLNTTYKGYISMPSPKSSGTGYMFYLSLVNALGEQEAITYFDSLANNIVSFTSSGSGPINALVQREAAIGLGMITQAVEKINGGNDDLEILIFEEGAPCNLYGNAIVKGKETRQSVLDVMSYITNTFTDANCAKYYPEPVLKNTNYAVANYPSNIKYADMSDNTIERKEALLSKWTR